MTGAGATPDSARPRYLHGHQPVVVEAHALRTADEAARFVAPWVHPGIRLLDLGCGPGSITAGLAGWVGPTGMVVGLDAGREVLDVARATHPDLHLVAGEAAALPFRSGSFDLVYAHQVLQHVADPIRVLGEVRRVLRPGGVAAVRDADYGTMTHYPTDPLLDRWLELYFAAARAVGGNPDAGRRLLSWIGAAGFTRPVVTTSTWTYADPAGRRHWAGLWSGRIRSSSFAAHALSYGLTTQAELEDIAAAWDAWSGRDDAFFTFVHVEVVAQRA